MWNRIRKNIIVAPLSWICDLINMLEGSGMCVMLLRVTNIDHLNDVAEHVRLPYNYV